MKISLKSLFAAAAFAAYAFAPTASAVDDHLVWKSGRYGVPPAANTNNAPAPTLAQSPSTAQANNNFALVAARFKNAGGNYQEDTKKKIAPK